MLYLQWFRIIKLKLNVNRMLPNGCDICNGFEYKIEINLNVIQFVNLRMLFLIMYEYRISLSIITALITVI